MNTPLARNISLVTLALALQVVAVSGQVTNSTYVGPDNDVWNDPANWSPAVVPNNAGANVFDVTIDNKTVNLDIDPTLNSLIMPGDAPYLYSTDHSIKIGATDTVAFGDIEFTAELNDVKCDLGNYAAFSGTRLDETAWFLVLTAAAGKTAALQFNGAHIVDNNGSFSFRGLGTTKVVDENGADALRDLTHNDQLAFFEVADGAIYTFPNTFVNEGTLAPDHGGTIIFAKDLTQIGDLRDPAAFGGFLEVDAFSPNLNAKAVVNGVLTNYDAATKTLHRGRFNIQAETGSVATMQVLGGALFDIVNNDASILLGGDASILDKNGANALRNLATSTRSLRLIRHDFTTIGSLSSGSSADNIALLAVRGDSRLSVAGDLSILAGGLELSPLPGYDLTQPPSDSQLTVSGNLSLASDGYVRFEVFAGMGRIFVNGSASLAGTLQIFVLPDAPITTSGSLTLLNADSITGHFSNVASGERVTAYKPTDLLFKGQFGGAIIGTFKATYDNDSLVISDFQPHASARNISTRAKVSTGENVTIGGFIVRGLSPKQVIIRGLGPSLTAAGVANVLQNPSLELHDSTGAVLMSNDDWQDTQASDITNSGLAPSDPHESAIVATLDPGAYTAILRGVGDTSGVGLVEVYDLDDQPSASELSNLSTRGRVETGDDVMIGGLIVGPESPADVVARALGASLAQQGVVHSLGDPLLEIYNAAGTRIDFNDNWHDRANDAAALQSAKLAPTDSLESALILHALAPGAYTAIVRGNHNTQGVALIEFYKLN